LDSLQDVQGVNGVYMNWAKGSIPNALWDELRTKTTV